MVAGRPTIRGDGYCGEWYYEIKISSTRVLLLAAYNEDGAKESDFSVVLFRSDFVLVSEKNHMKVHKNQWIGTMSYPPERLSGVTRRGQTMVPGGAEAFAVTGHGTTPQRYGLTTS
jgi:hypothetical protein